jgi:hypothetical protein
VTKRAKKQLKLLLKSSVRQSRNDRRHYITTVLFPQMLKRTYPDSMIEAEILKPNAFLRAITDTYATAFRLREL